MKKFVLAIAFAFAAGASFAQEDVYTKFKCVWRRVIDRVKKVIVLPMPKILIFAVLFVVLPYICFSYEEIYIGSNGNKLKLAHTLPRTFPKIGKVEDLGKLFEKFDEKNGLPNAELWIELRGNDLVFLFETKENHFFEDLYSSGSLYLLPCYYYLKNINVWFFDDIQSLNNDRPSIIEDLRNLNIQYWFTLMKDDNYIQIEGKVGRSYSALYGRAITDMILYEPLFIRYNNENLKVSSEIYFQDRYFYEFKLGSPYNSITNEYFPSYFVYLFFNDYNALKNVPQ
jgi:hypothetical protein